MKRIILSIVIPSVVFLLFILFVSLEFGAGGLVGFFSGNLQCDVSFGPISTQHPCGYIEFLSDVLYLAYIFFINGWWAIVIGAMIVLYAGLGFIKKYWWIAIILVIIALIYFAQAYM